MISVVNSSRRAAAPRPGARDFPFYDGQPVALSVGRWLSLIAMVAVGFAALVGLPHLWPGDAGRWGGILLFVALPLLGLRFAAGRYWTAIFHRPTGREVLIGLAFVPVTLVVSSLVALGIMRLAPTAANPFVALLEQLKGGNLALFVAGTGPQLLGEELVTILPFLALLALFRRPLGLPRRIAVAGAWIVSAGIFAALHLPTYQWHLAQTLAVIGSARLMLSLPYIITKNIWSSTITHIVHDWLLFVIVAVAFSFGGAA
jgi:membrane protease YdiL (CAAX protease family)